jgi:hypothetical protein
MSEAFRALLADRLDAYREILACARELVSALERHADERLGEIQERRARAMTRVERLGALPSDLRPALLEAVRPLADEARRFDDESMRLLEQRRARLLAQIVSARALRATDAPAGSLLNVSG